MNEFDQVLSTMEKLGAKYNPLYSKRIGRDLGLSGREVGYLLRQMHAENRVILTDVKKWKLPP